MESVEGEGEKEREGERRKKDGAEKLVVSRKRTRREERSNAACSG